MFDPHLKSTGRDYTATAALITGAFIFSPVVLVASRPFGYVSIALAAACSAACLTLAWLNWKKSSQLSIPSIEVHFADVK